LNVSVRLHHKIPAPTPENSCRVLDGYFRWFGASGASIEDVKAYVNLEIEDGSVEWQDSEINPRIPIELNEEIRAKSGDWTRTGVWYRSGHAYYSDSDDSDGGV
jgi:hypothetical protein